MPYQLAQVNVSRLLAPIDSRRLRGFVAEHDRVNAAARAAPGFVWRMQDDLASGAAVTGFEWDAAGSVGVVANLSVWQDVESLAAFTYGAAHRTVLARRRDWFEQMPEAHLALWWIESGSRPTTAEAGARLRQLRDHGPTPEAFTLQAPFPRPGNA